MSRQTRKNPAHFDFAYDQLMRSLLVKRLECYSGLKKGSLKLSCGINNCPKTLE